MQIREFRLEPDDGMAVAGDVPGASGTGTHPQYALDHRVDDRRVAPHTEIVVRAPDDDLAGIVATAPSGIGRALRVPLQIGENAIAAFPADTIEIRQKMVAQGHLVFHWLRLKS